MTLSAVETWNNAAFLALTAGQQPWPVILIIAKVLAIGAVDVICIALVLGWLRSGRPLRFALLDATLSAWLGLGIAVGITLIWYHPRPFEIGLGQQWIPHATDASFPSDHGTLTFALAFSLLFSARRIWGLGFLALAFGVAWARIYLGVHFPLDMLGAAAVAGLGSALVHWARPVLHSKVYPVLNRFYEKQLRQLRLPTRIFPRDL